ncbi:phage protein NinX family protein [Morganella morganii]|uniref:phage protein NinX family protein n=1 Tax=Morganella morganii TaxID=582 RepID=UPI003EB9A2D6
MSKYRDKSDFEINKAVAEVINPGKIFTQAYSFGDTCGNSVQWIGGYAEYIHVDYCNNPSDAMPIVIENGISLFAPGLSGMWTAGYVDYETDREYGVDNYEAINKNPYRAAMEVFLMMKDAENES